MSADWVSIRPIGSFNLAKTIECGQMFRWRRIHHPDIGDHYEIVIYGNVVRIQQVDGDIMFSSAPVPPKEFRPKLENYLALDYGLEQTYDALSLDPSGVMQRLTKELCGLRILRQDPWECLVSFICTANTDMCTTRRLVEGMACRFGERIQINGHDHHTFPSPEVLAKAGSDQLEQLFKELHAERASAFATYVAAAAKKVCEDDSYLSKLRGLPFDGAFRSICRFKGVSEKIGNCVLLFSFGEYNAFPVDRHVEEALKRWYNRRSQNPATLRKWGQKHFGSHAGYASQYLFHCNRIALRIEKDIVSKFFSNFKRNLPLYTQAAGAAGDLSYFGLLVVMDNAPDSSRAEAEILQALGNHPPIVDIRVTTPEEITRSDHAVKTVCHATLRDGQFFFTSDRDSCPGCFCR